MITKRMKLLAILVLLSVVSFAGCKKDSVAKTYTLNLTATNGTVVKNPDLAVYNSGATVQLTATPNSGYTFNGWSGDATGTGNPKNIVMDGNKTVTATFLKQTVYTLAVACDPTAGGSVVMNPSGGAYVAGTAVAMTAAANSGYTFTGWSGDATGTSNPKTIVMDGNKTVTATFSLIVVNVKSMGATGDGITDDTRAIQTAIDQVGGTGGTVLVPNGTYMINAIDHLNLKSTMTFKMETGAVLKAIPNGSSQYAIIKISGLTNVTVTGGTVQGERHQHLTPGDYGPSTYGDQWGMGIWIDHNSIHVSINGVTARECWGDGFYLGGPGVSDVSFNSVVADDNRRQGMSITGSADGIIVNNSIFKNTKGQEPMAGIDIEPNETNMTVRNVQILNSQFINNFFTGIVSTAQNSENVTIDGCTFTGNGGRDSQIGGMVLLGASNNTIKNNVVNNNVGWGISMYRGATGNTVINNQVIYNSLDGIFLGSNGNTITGNNLYGNTATDDQINYISYNSGGAQITISGNTNNAP